MNSAFAERAGRLVAVATASILFAATLVVAPAAAAEVDEPDGVVDPSSGLALSIAEAIELPEDAVDPVDASAFVPGTPVISGTAQVGRRLDVAIGDWSPVPEEVSYQWLRAGQIIQGATASSYTATASDAGKTLSVRVSGSGTGYAPATVTSAPTATVVAGALAGATPTLSGTLAVGSTLTAVPGSWTPKPGYAYQWLRNGARIAGATKATYKLTSADAGKQISVSVTGTSPGYAKLTKTSSKSAKVATATTPRITGTVKVGSTLSISRGTWTASTAFGYRWLRDGVPISGATGSRYKLVAADAGKRITVAVTGKRSGYATVTKTSAASAAVAKGTLAAPAPKITGTVKVGVTLKVSTGTWTSGTSLKYQWFRNGKAIPGATSKTYRVRPSDAYAALSVKVTGTKAGYATAAKASSRTAAVKGKVYSTCAQLNADYPDGIRKSTTTFDLKAGKRKPFVGSPYPSTSLYNLQSKQRDRDRDGIMCER